ncbi:unnamed protein product [Schistocephalus solidus]|uniref:Reverse transcriptase domain-containing protein n=1 Tax=Schistocephalus solidus TaxID=70667 RepID=A0A183TT73_SCHSO|nr:unnamed protein product [Schistocephalus solidus]
MQSWIKELDAKDTVHVAYIDFQKAYDSVPHQRLLYKLRMFGIGGKLLTWIKNFLVGRFQVVWEGGSRSKRIVIESGVPQGLVLGPILFLLLINDCVQDLDCNFALFAEDIKIWNVIHNAAERDDFQENLCRLDEWARNWLLSFNSNQCTLLRLGNQNQVTDMRPYYLNGLPLREVHTQKNLGVWMKDNLKPSTQCCKADKSANSMLYAFIGDLDCNFAMFAEDIKIWNVIHNAADRDDFQENLCRLDEWARNWLLSFNSNQCTLLRLGNQNQVTDMRPYYLNGLPLREVHTQKNLGVWMKDNLKPSTQCCKADKSANSMLQLRGDLIQTFRIMRGMDCALLCDAFFQLATTNNLRGHQFKLSVPQVRLDLRKYVFTNLVAEPWNDLPEVIVMSQAVNTFKHRRYIHLLQHHEDFVTTLP